MRACVLPAGSRSQADELWTQCSNAGSEWNSDRLCTSASGMNSCMNRVSALPGPNSTALVTPSARQDSMQAAQSTVCWIWRASLSAPARRTRQKRRAMRPQQAVLSCARHLRPAHHGSRRRVPSLCLRPIFALHRRRSRHKAPWILQIGSNVARLRPRMATNPEGCVVASSIAAARWTTRSNTSSSSSKPATPQAANSPTL